MNLTILAVAAHIEDAVPFTANGGYTFNCPQDYEEILVTKHCFEYVLRKFHCALFPQSNIYLLTSILVFSTFLFVVVPFNHSNGCFTYACSQIIVQKATPEVCNLIYFCTDQTYHSLAGRHSFLHGLSKTIFSGASSSSAANIYPS